MTKIAILAAAAGLALLASPASAQHYGHGHGHRHFHGHHGHASHFHGHHFRHFNHGYHAPRVVYKPVHVQPVYKAPVAHKACFEVVRQGYQVWRKQVACGEAVKVIEKKAEAPVEAPVEEVPQK